MKNEIMVFENSEFGRIRVVEHNGSEWFVAHDISCILGYAQTNNMNKLIHAQDKCVRNLQNGGNYVNQALINESGLYAAIFGSTLPNAIAFKHWVTSEVLPAIRKTGSYSSAENILKKVPFMEFDKHSLSVVFDLLKPSENSKLMMVHKLFDKHGADKNLLPQFTEKVKPIFSATKLLEDFGKPMSIRDFNKKMREKGFLEIKTRKSRKDGVSDKTFWSLTSTGLDYGQNDVSPQNPLETQPHYYEETFASLLDILTAYDN